LIKAAWTNAISRGFGKVASKELPSFIQTILNTLYVKVTGVDLQNFEPASHYKTLNKLFTRELRFDRDMPKDPKIIVSPADSLISEMGDIKGSTALQIKNHSYCINELLTEYISKEHIERVIDGTFLNFYLSPKDYHRYHVPTDMRVSKVIHVPGLLYPVNFTYLKKVDSLFVKNERVILECYDNNKNIFYMILVGALNVGKMTLSFEPKIETNIDASKIQVYKYDDVNLKQGDELGMFMMGSTVVMLFEKDAVELNTKVGKKVRFGEGVATKCE
jgi:phosphatidylserine decarboxylase